MVPFLDRFGTKTRVFIFIVLVLAIGMGVYDTKHLAFRFLIEGDSYGCPFESSNDTSLVAAAPQRGYFIAGEVAKLKCDARGANWSVSLANFGDQFIVYPSVHRTCQSNGTWSTPPPFCLWNKANVRDNLNVEPAGISKLDYKLNEPGWVPIGNLICSGDKNEEIADANELMTQSFHYFEFKFSTHNYFSFIEISATTNIENVVVYADEATVIENELSAEARNFKQTHYEKWRENHPAVVPISQKSRCLFTELTVYTNTLRVRYSENVPINAQEKTPTVQEQMRKLDSKMNVTFFAFKPQASRDGCPELPRIPNTELLKTSQDGVFSYSCPAGYVLMDPVKRMPASNGTLSCQNGHWTPYPFYVCAHIVDVENWNVKPAQQRGGSPFIEGMIAGFFAGCIITSLTGYLCRKKLIERFANNVNERATGYGTGQHSIQTQRRGSSTNNIQQPLHHDRAMLYNEQVESDDS